MLICSHLYPKQSCGSAHRNCPSWLNSPSACLWFVSCRDLVLVWENIMGLLGNGIARLMLVWMGMLTVDCACPLLAILCWTCGEKRGPTHEKKKNLSNSSTFMSSCGKKKKKSQRWECKQAQREKRWAARRRLTLGCFNLSLDDNQIKCLLLRREHWFRRRVVICWWLKVISFHASLSAP